SLSTPTCPPLFPPHSHTLHSPAAAQVLLNEVLKTLKTLKAQTLKPDPRSHLHAAMPQALHSTQSDEIVISLLSSPQTVCPDVFVALINHKSLPCVLLSLSTIHGSCFSPDLQAPRSFLLAHFRVWRHNHQDRSVGTMVCRGGGRGAVYKGGKATFYDFNAVLNAYHPLPFLRVPR
ncbi:hypothetical protein B0H11DRAFT_206185, partial [Mycena galericulata]